DPRGDATVSPSSFSQQSRVFWISTHSPQSPEPDLDVIIASTIARSPAAIGPQYVFGGVPPSGVTIGPASGSSGSPLLEPDGRSPGPNAPEFWSILSGSSGSQVSTGRSA